MIDIVKRLRDYIGDDHERGCAGRYYDCSCGYDDKKDPLIAAAADKITRLRNELHIAEVWSARIIAGTQQDVIEIARLRAENERLRAALESVMIGGNSLAQIIGADHPPHGTPYNEALTHYGGGVKYEAWCCWNAIMLARAALEGK